jgi:DNA/RNA-binding domain of Phe-tRNA-synthetase-like protein
MDLCLEFFKERIAKEVRENHNIESLKGEPALRAYRDFFWEIKVDPTKTRSAAEALITTCDFLNRFCDKTLKT